MLQAIGDDDPLAGMPDYLPEEDRVEFLGVVDKATLRRDQEELDRERDVARDPFRFLDQYSASADMVAVGVVDSVHCVSLSTEERASLGSLASVYRSFSVSIGTSLRGPVTDSVAVITLGGSCGGESETWSHQPDLRVDHEYLFFLATAGSGFPGAVAGSEAATARHIIGALQLTAGSVSVFSTPISIDTLGEYFRGGSE